MKIKTDSWHFQVQKMVGITDPWERTNLCAYIRGILITLLLPPLMVLAPFVLYIIFPYVQENQLPASLSPIGVMIFLMLVLYSMFATFVDGIIIVLSLYVWIDDNIVSKLPERKPNVYVQKEPSIVIEYLKAKKRKICPLIQFE